MIMGVLNVTPDSFSDGGLYATTESAVECGRRLVAEGADILDVGGESTRPATFQDGLTLDVEEEIGRVLPVIRALSAEFPTVPISIDTYKSAVAAAALDGGATIVNDISGLTYDPGMAALVAARKCPVVIMHILGQPKDIPAEPVYDDVVTSIAEFFHRQIEYAYRLGVRDNQILLDPGIGFGKNASHNLEILRRLKELTDIGYPVVVGASRKRFIGKVLNISDPLDRLEGTAATVALSIASGASIVRVHDVKQMSRVAKMADAVVRGWVEEES